MKRREVCHSCVLGDLHGALDRLELDSDLRERITSASRRFLDGSFPDRRPPSYYITGVHRIVKRMSGIDVPFEDLRAACNEVGFRLAAQIAGEVEQLPREERFRRLCSWAVAGNHLDFRTVGAGYGFSVERIREMLEEKVRAGFAVDEVDRIEEILSSSKRILYVPDNVGEIAFDRLLVLHLREGGARVAVPYRGGPITSDATLADFQAVRLTAAADHVFPAGPDTLGVSFAEMSAELTAEIASADAVLTKGQANFYEFHEARDRIDAPICSLLTTKCDVVSEIFGRRGRINVAAVLSRGRRR